MNKINQFTEKYAFLSNFYNCPVTYQNITFSNSEAAFQAAKCLHTNEREMFRNLSAGDAKRLGRQVPLRSDWEDVKVQVMKDIVYAKFAGNPDLREKLLETDNAYLEEGNTWGDKVWGAVNGSGRNLLGEILMETRALFRDGDIEKRIDGEGR